MWRAIEPGRLWEAEHLSDAGLPLRSVAIELRGGGVCVISPTRSIDPAPLVEHAGSVRYLLAPNHFHYLGVQRWLEQCPGAVAVCSPVAKRRLAKKVDVPWSDLDDLASALPDDASLLVPEGTRNGEVWVRLGKTWIVCDAFFNLPHLPSGALGVFCRLTQTGPGLKLGQTWKYLALADSKAYAAWLRGVLDEHPVERLVPAHGAVEAGVDLAARLRGLVDARL
jgi:hypothetical protein